MKLLQINPVLRTSTSTGKIMQEIGDLAMKRGWESYVAYSKGRDGLPECTSRLVPVGNSLDVAWHAVETRLFDRHGLASRLATRRFVREIEKIQPDIIHIHNIHGYFLNYRILFEFLATYGKPVIWTVHDCWLFTGHCYHYASAGCYKWKTGCRDCPQKRAFPASWWIDRSEHNYKDKQRSFNLLDKRRFVIAPASEWMAREMKDSMLGDCQFKVMHNGIDLGVFAPQTEMDGVRKRYGTADKYVILAVASKWLLEKGVEDLLRMAKMLRDDEVIVMVGVDDELLKRLPASIIGIRRTENAQELAALYSMATALVNPTWQDNYPTVNLEAIACGTPVVTYRTGGSPESITPETGFVVEQGDVKGMLAKVREIENKGKNYYTAICRNHAVRCFNKEDRYADYIDLYEKLI